MACTEMFPEPRAVALYDVRGRSRGGQHRPRRAGDDPGRQLDRRPGGRHPPPAAGLRAAHHRRALPADPLPADGRARHDDRLDPDRAQPRPRARPVPQDHPRARLVDGRRRRHRRRRPRGRRARRPDGRRAVTARRGRSCTGWTSSPRTSRTSTTTRPASWCCPANRDVPPVGSGPVITSFVYRVRNVSAALYKALGGFATNGVNMTKLESYQLGGGSSPPSSTPTSRATPRTRTSPWPWKSSPSSPSRSACSASTPRIPSAPDRRARRQPRPPPPPLATTTLPRPSAFDGLTPMPLS